MKLIFSHQNPMIVENIKNIVELDGVETILKNASLAGAAGELAPMDTWPEVWVVNDDHYQRAIALVNSVSDSKNTVEWVCGKCSEKNDAAFEVCWKCQSEQIAE
ncbi:MAG: hypothetical protein ACI9Y1_000502 [Lentisphaeria bacterium]|jgi:hypothetical protein